MSNTQIDYLLQLPLPRPESGVTARSRGDGPPFDSLFQQASDAADSASPAPLRTAADSSDARRQPASESQRPPAPPAAQASGQPDDAQDSHEKLNTDEGDSEEASVEFVSAAATQAPVESAKDTPATDEAAADKSQPVEDAVQPATKPNRKPTVAANQCAVEDLIPESASTSPDTDTPADADQAVVTTPVDEIAAAGDSPIKPTVATEVVDDVDAVQAAIATTEAATTEATATDQPADAPTTRKTRRNAATSAKSIDESSSKSEPDQSTKRSEKRAAETDAKVAAASADAANVATEESQGEQADAPLTAAGEKATTKVKSDGDAESPAAQQRPATAVRAASAPAAPVAAAVPASAVANSTESGTADFTTKTKSIGSDAKESVLTTFARIERNGAMGGRGAHRSGEGHGAPHVDPARFVSRVARAIHTAQDRGTPLLLRLSPPELGSLRLELSVQHGALFATVEADNQNARQLLLDNLPALRDRLADQNIRIERFDVDVRRDGEGGEQPSFNPNQHRDEQHDRTSHRPGTNRGPVIDDAVDAVPVLPQAITNTSINVVA